MKRRFVTDEVKNKMRELEAAGKTRKEIAKELNLDAASVTRGLGAVRQYRGARIPKAA